MKVSAAVLPGRRRWCSGVATCAPRAGPLPAAWRHAVLAGVLVAAVVARHVGLCALWAPLAAPRLSDPMLRKVVGPKAAAKRHRCRIALAGVDVEERAPPATKAPRQRKMSTWQRKTEAIKHAVVAIELLTFHGKLGGSFPVTFRRCAYVPIVSRLRILTCRTLSGGDPQIDPNRSKFSDPKRLNDRILERQHALPAVYTERALKALQRGLDSSAWQPLGQWRNRQELMIGEATPSQDPHAIFLASFCQGHVDLGNGERIDVRNRVVGHGEATENRWILPVYVEHDRAPHVERQSLLVFLEALPLDKDDVVLQRVTAKARFYSAHTPCISCLSCMCQFTRAFPGASLSIGFDIWRESRRWTGFKVKAMDFGDAGNDDNDEVADEYEYEDDDEDEETYQVETLEDD